MKIIHCADLHLNSRMESNLPPEKARERRYELFDTFAAMVDYAKNNGVRAVIIAGDMFDTENGCTRIKNRVLDLIKSSPETDFLYLKGNHDSADFPGETQYPKNLKLFGSGWTVYSYDGTDIIGSESCSDADGFPELDEKRVNIVVLHGQEKIGNLPGDNLIDIQSFANRGIDYMALGHIHSYKCQRLDERGEYCYCGCLEGRGFDECGDKGFILLDTGADGVIHQFIPFAKRRLYTVNVRLSGAPSGSDMIDAANGALSGISSDGLVKIVFEGDVDEQTDIDTEYIRRRFESSFYFVKVVDNTSVLIDYERYKNDVSLKGGFIRAVNESGMEEERKKKVIMTGLRSLAGRELDI